MPTTAPMTGPSVADGDRILNTSHLAARYGVHARTIVKWLNEGRFGKSPGAYRLPGQKGPWRVTADAASAYDEYIRSDR
jgi:hypothetical protein